MSSTVRFCNICMFHLHFCFFFFKFHRASSLHDSKYSLSFLRLRIFSFIFQNEYTTSKLRLLFFFPIFENSLDTADFNLHISFVSHSKTAILKLLLDTWISFFSTEITVLQNYS